MRVLGVVVFIIICTINVFAGESRSQSRFDSTHIRNSFFERLNEINKIEEDSLRIREIDHLVYDFTYPLPDYACSLANASLPYADSIKDTTMIVNFMLDMGVTLRMIEELDSSQLIYNRILEYLKDYHYPKGLALAYTGIAQVYYHRSEFKKSTEYCLRGMAVAETNRDSARYVIALNTLGVIHYSHGNYDEALVKFEECLRYCEAIGDSTNIETLNNNLGAIYKGKMEVRKAIKYFEKAIEVGDYQYAKPLINIGECYMMIDEFDKAQKYLDLAIGSNLVPGSHNDVLVHNNLGNLYGKQGLNKKALFHLKKSLAMAKANTSVNSTLDILNAMSHTYAQMGDYKKAYECKEEFATLNDSIFNADHHSRITEMEQKYKAEHRQNEIVQLRKESEISSIKIMQEKEKQQILIIILAVIIIFIVILFFLYNQKTRLSKAIERQKVVVENQNDMLQEGLDEKNILIKEVHHRVKNNLQIISSLLSLQSNTMKENPEVLQALKDARSRIESMSLIHQHLYQTETLKEVDCKEYFEELFNYLHFLMESNDRLEVQIETNDIRLGIDTIIPLGIILNELMTNAIKYAFSDINKGIVQVSLSQVEEGLVLVFKDNGRGVGEDFDFDGQTSLGVKLINLLSKKLKGKIEFFNDNGLTFKMRFKALK